MNKIMENIIKPSNTSELDVIANLVKRGLVPDKMMDGGELSHLSG